jgi:acetoacetyl-CoA synthetase
MGTSEFYRLVDGLDAVADSLVVDTGSLGQEGKLFLFVVLQEGYTLDSTLLGEVRSMLRAALSPRHVPDQIRQVKAVPRTLNGKKLEVPIKRIFNGTPVDEAVNRDTLSDPSCLQEYIDLARTLH